jgi:hypothetical protein
VDVQDSSALSNRDIRVMEAALPDKAKEQEELETSFNDRASPVAPVLNRSRRHEPCPVPPCPAPPTMSTGAHPKPGTQSIVLEIQSGAGEVSQRAAKTVPRKAADPKPSAPKTKAASTTAQTTKMGASTEDSNPYALDDAVGGLLQVGEDNPSRSPTRQKQSTVTSTEEAGAGKSEEPQTKVRSKAARRMGSAGEAKDRKLVVFNLHGTLVDSSLLADKNPNSAIRATVTTENRRLTFRPWLVKFLVRCFLNFNVSFWDSKSEVYMQEVLATVLGRTKEITNCTPLFVWSGKECEVTACEDGVPVIWGKPLEKVFRSYPDFNHSNTVIVDHRICRLGGNSAANLIIPTAFYVAEMQKLGDDKGFLKGCLWPLLQGLYRCKDIKHFRTHYPDNVVDPAVKVQKLCGTEETSASTKTVEGEGTCRR